MIVAISGLSPITMTVVPIFILCLLLFGCDVRIIKQLKLLCKSYCKIYLYKVYCILDNNGNDNVHR